MSYSVIVEEEPRQRLFRLDKTTQERIAKKLKQLERDDVQSRHLKHGLPYFVEDVGQYRTGFKTKTDLKEKRVMFIGDHKEYEKWFKSF